MNVHLRLTLASHIEGQMVESWRVGELESWRVGELESWRGLERRGDGASRFTQESVVVLKCLII